MAAVQSTAVEVVLRVVTSEPGVELRVYFYSAGAIITCSGIFFVSLTHSTSSVARTRVRLLLDVVAVNGTSRPGPGVPHAFDP